MSLWYLQSPKISKEMKIKLNNNPTNK